MTNENYLTYISRIPHYKLNEQIKLQSHAFRKGFWSIIEKNWLRIFSPEELTELIGGSEDFNVEDLQRNTVYQGEYHPMHTTIRYFWEVKTIIIVQKNLNEF